MKIKHGLIAAALTLGTIALSATPAMALGVGGSGPQLVVISYLDGSNNVVGQHWFGCPGQPSGNWGQTTSRSSLSTTPC